MNKTTDTTNSTQVHLYLSAGVGYKKIHSCNYIAYRKSGCQTTPTFLECLILAFYQNVVFQFPSLAILLHFNQGSKSHGLYAGSGFMCESRSQLDLKKSNYFLQQQTFLWLLAGFLVLLKAQKVDGWPLRLLLWSVRKETVLWEITRFLEITFKTDEINCPLNVSPSLLTAGRQVWAGYLANTATQCWMRQIPSHK